MFGFGSLSVFIVRGSLVMEFIVGVKCVVVLGMFGDGDWKGKYICGFGFLEEVVFCGKILLIGDVEGG